MSFYQKLGFAVVAEGTFEKGQPIIMQHEAGIVLNLLGPAVGEDENVLMDVKPKRAGYTHMSLRVASLDDALAFMEKEGIEITERFSFKDLNAFFIRDPDRNVIEFDWYPGRQPEARGEPDHP